MKNFIYILPLLLIVLISYFIIKKYYTNKDGQSFSQSSNKEIIIDRAAAIKLFNKMKGSVVLNMSLGGDVGGESWYQDKLLFIYFDPMKEFEEDGQKKISYAWCIGITWGWVMYDTDKRDARGIPQELCSMMDSIEKIKEQGEVLGGKKLTAAAINDTSIEFDFEHIRLAVVMPEKEDVYTAACYLITPDNEILTVFRDKITLKIK